MEFVNMPQATVTAKIQYDTDGNIWKSSTGKEKGAYKTLSIPLCSSVATWGDFWSEDEGSIGVLISLLVDGFGMSVNTDASTRQLTQETEESEG